MAKTSIIKKHLTVSEIDKCIKETKGFWKIQRWLVIRQGLITPSSAESLGKSVGLKKSTTQLLISNYNKYGKSAINTKGKGGRKYGYMTLEQEKEFLKSCEQKALSGQYTTVLDIQKAFEKIIGNTVAKTTVYNLLKRHGWRKLVPRPSHPKSDIEKQNTFKKTSISK